MKVIFIKAIHYLLTGNREENPSFSWLFSPGFEFPSGVMIRENTGHRIDCFL